MLIRLILLALCLSACQATATPAAPAPTATRSVVNTIEPTKAAEFPAPTPALAASRTITFTTADGIELNGTLYGRGDTVVILSAMSDKRQDTWTAFARQIAAQGYQALTYDYRHFSAGQKMQDSVLDKAADDLRAAAKFAREQGAKRVVFIGASLGGLASIHAAHDAQPAAMVVMAAPFGPFPRLPSLQVAETDLQALTMPKLFINTERDQIGFADDTQAMFEAAPEPKEIQIYPGSAHSTDVFKTDQAEALTQRLIDFLQQYVPPEAR